MEQCLEPLEVIDQQQIIQTGTVLNAARRVSNQVIQQALVSSSAELPGSDNPSGKTSAPPRGFGMVDGQIPGLKQQGFGNDGIYVKCR